MNDPSLLAERNQLAREVCQSQLALGPFATIYDTFLETKGEAWCQEWQDAPLHHPVCAGVLFRMPTLSDCRKAKLAAEGQIA